MNFFLRKSSVIIEPLYSLKFISFMKKATAISMLLVIVAALTLVSCKQAETTVPADDTTTQQEQTVIETPVTDITTETPADTAPETTTQE